MDGADPRLGRPQLDHVVVGAEHRAKPWDARGQLRVRRELIEGRTPPDPVEIRDAVPVLAAREVPGRRERRYGMLDGTQHLEIALDFSAGG
ncbi:MAG: hypothetical protein NT062_29255 [Proteobacteria bacterium]|nr:hypothetical protein [Pseudomonadota bacterium]